MTLDLPLISPVEIKYVQKILPSVLMGTMVEVLTDCSGFTTNGPLNIFSPTELAKAAGYTNEKRKMEYLGGRYAIKSLLGKGLLKNIPLNLITVENTPNGAPFIKLDTNSTIDPAIEPGIATMLRSSIISLTHKAQVIMAVVGNNANLQGLGIDLEYRTPKKTIEKARERMIELIGSPEESSIIERELSGIRRNHYKPAENDKETDPFLALFSIKEAAYKVLKGEASTLRKIALKSFSLHKLAGYPRPCFYSTLLYDCKRIEGITIELEYVVTSLAWIY
jgi:phosphopantetheinyl transferase (holo-ACP synthase)